jgi:hypothetical protein
MFKFSKQPNSGFISFVSAAGVFIYISAVSWMISNTKNLFGNVPEPNFLIPVFMLLLFVVSAAITGSLVFGKPLLMYIDGEKKGSLKLLFGTLAWLVLFLFLVVIALLVQ